MKKDINNIIDEMMEDEEGKQILVDYKSVMSAIESIRYRISKNASWRTMNKTDYSTEQVLEFLKYIEDSMKIVSGGV